VSAVSRDSAPRPILVAPAQPLPWRAPASLRDQHEALERGMASCLRIFAELAAVTGESDRAMRLRTAADFLHAGGPSLQPHQSSGAAAPIAHLPRRTSRRKRCSLTDRELQVARLIAGGLTNRQIAAELEISERTADTHVQNMLNRLGAVSRAQLAAWIAARDH
jgi:DNA-binding NarL/FixJ family response regulator